MSDFHFLSTMRIPVCFPDLFVIMANLPTHNLLGFSVCEFDSHIIIDFGFVLRLFLGAYYSINISSIEEQKGFDIHSLKPLFLVL